MEMRAALELLGGFTTGQWGMVTSRQAKTVGVDAVTLFRLKDAGYLDGVRRGVYAATTAVVTAAREEQAAWLSVRPGVAGWERDPLDGDDAVLSHATATRLHGLGELTNSEIAMTASRRRTSRDPDIWFKRARLDKGDVTLLDGLPVTTVLRTVCDLLDQHIDASHIATIIRQAVLADQVRLDDLTDSIGPYARRYRVRPDDGAALLEHLLEQIGVAVADLVTRPAPAPFQLTAANQALQNIALGAGSGKTIAADRFLKELTKQASASSALAAHLHQVQELGNMAANMAASTQFFAKLAEQHRELAALPDIGKQFAALVDEYRDLGSRLPANITQILSGSYLTSSAPSDALEQAGRGEGAGERDESADEDD